MWLARAWAGVLRLASGWPGTGSRPVPAPGWRCHRAGWSGLRFARAVQLRVRPVPGRRGRSTGWPGSDRVGRRGPGCQRRARHDHGHGRAAAQRGRDGGTLAVPGVPGRLSPRWLAVPGVLRHEGPSVGARSRRSAPTSLADRAARSRLVRPVQYACDGQGTVHPGCGIPDRLGASGLSRCNKCTWRTTGIGNLVRDIPH